MVDIPSYLGMGKKWDENSERKRHLTDLQSSGCWGIWIEKEESGFSGLLGERLEPIGTKGKKPKVRESGSEDFKKTPPTQNKKAVLSVDGRQGKDWENLRAVADMEERPCSRGGKTQSETGRRNYIY